MRLIDADELKREISQIVAEESPYDDHWATGLKYSLKVIDKAQTIEKEDK